MPTLQTGSTTLTAPQATTITAGSTASLSTAVAPSAFGAAAGPTPAIPASVAGLQPTQSITTSTTAVPPAAVAAVPPASTASVAASVASPLSPSRVSRVALQLPRSGLIVTPGQAPAASGAAAAATASVTDADRQRLLERLRDWRYRDLAEFVDVQMLELDALYEEVFHANHVALLSMTLMREDLHDRLGEMSEVMQREYDYTQRMDRELDYMGAECDEMESVLSGIERTVSGVSDRVADEKQRMPGSAIAAQQMQHRPGVAPAVPFSNQLIGVDERREGLVGDHHGANDYRREL